MSRLISLAGILVFFLFSLGTKAGSVGKFDEIDLKQLESGHYLLNVSLARTQLNFILDTGATGSVLDNLIAKNLKLKKLDQQIEGAAAGEKSIETGLVAIDSLWVGNHESGLSELFIQDLSIFNGLYHEPIHGILGQDAIKRLSMIIDLTSNRLLLPNASTELSILEPFKGTGKIPLRRHPSGLYTLSAKINQLPVRFVLDTGAPQIVIDKRFANKRFQDDLSELKNQYGIGPDGEKRPLFLLQKSEVKLGKTSLGENHLVDDLANVLKILEDEKKAPVAGVIGLNDLKRLNAKIDLKNETVYF